MGTKFDPKESYDNTLKKGRKIKMSLLICSDYFSSITGFLSEKLVCDTNSKLATICDQDFSVGCADGELGKLYINFQNYSEESILRIRKQADEWQIKKQYSEEWDPEFGYENKDMQNHHYTDIPNELILVRNDNFFGVIDYSYDLGGHYGLFYASVESYSGTPLVFQYGAYYGSSDHDMYEEIYSYLTKKTDSKDQKNNNISEI